VTATDAKAPALATLAPRLVQALGPRALVLVGMPGSGKTTIGKRLATVLGLAFVDADHEIERAAQMTIPEIFTQFGEAEFREGEKRVMARLMEGGCRVIATGGGAFMAPETRAAIRARGVSVWLKTDLDVLLARVKRKNNRPLLQGTDPRAALERLLALREPVFAEADVTVESHDVAHENTVHEIVSAILALPMRQATVAEEEKP